MCRLRQRVWNFLAFSFSQRSLNSFLCSTVLAESDCTALVKIASVRILSALVDTVNRFLLNTE